MQPLIVEEIYLATPQKIWKAISNEAQMKQWYFDIKNFELRVGCKFNFYEPGGTQFLHECVITEIIDGEKLQYSWTYPQLSKGKTIVTWNIIPENEQTKIILTHEGIETFADAGKGFAKEDFEMGWKEILGKSLKKFVEEK